MLTRRADLLRLLLTFTATPVYQDMSTTNTQPDQWRKVLTGPNFQHSSNLFYSLVNTV
jgi:hypothetical protein